MADSVLSAKSHAPCYTLLPSHLLVTLL